MCLVCPWKAAATYPWPVQSLKPVRLQAVNASEHRKAEGPHHTLGLQLIALPHGVLWRIQYCNPLHSPEMGAKSVAANTEASESPSITRGNAEAQGPTPTLSSLLQRHCCKADVCCHGRHSARLKAGPTARSGSCGSCVGCSWNHCATLVPIFKRQMRFFFCSALIAQMFNFPTFVFPGKCFSNRDIQS